MKDEPLERGPRVSWPDADFWADAEFEGPLDSGKSDMGENDGGRVSKDSSLYGKHLVAALDKESKPLPPPPPQEPAAAQKLSLAREAAFVAIICLAQFSTQFGLGSVLSILDVLGDSLGISNRGVLSWLMGGYSLTVGTFILVSGRLGDLFGHKPVLLAGYAWFGIWSIVAGLSVYSGSTLFIFARVLSGIGPSLTLPNALAILGVAYPPSPRKQLVFSVFGAVAPGGCVAGAALAGLLALAWWPWVYWAMGIVLILAAVLGYFIIPESPASPSTKSRSVRHFFEAADVLGGTVGVTALVLINFGWNQSGVVGWSQPYVYILLLVGVLLVPAFFWIELRIASAPLLPFDVVNKQVGIVLVCIACGWGSFGVWIFYTFQFFEHIRGASPLLTAAYLSPTAVVGAMASFITAYLLGRVRPATIMTIAMVAFTIGSILIATAPAHQTYWAQTFVMNVVISFGMDMSFPAASLIISDAVPRERQGIGMSLVTTVVNYAIAFALGVASTVEEQITGGDTSSTGATLKGYRSAWYFGIGLAGLGVAISVINLVLTKLAARPKRLAQRRAKAERGCIMTLEDSSPR